MGGHKPTYNTIKPNQKLKVTMSKIESIKQYEGQVLDNIFFRPMLTGDNAEQMGIKVMYNVPAPTTLHFWRRNGDVLQKYTSRGWNGGNPADKYQKKIELHKVKAEMAYSAEDYFSTVYELITNRPDVNLDDLSGTELEEAETTLFRASIAESIRGTMWYGNVNRPGGSLNTFDGFLKKIFSQLYHTDGSHIMGYLKDKNSPEWAEALLKSLWDNASEHLKSLRSEGQLTFFVTSDVYNAYEECLDNVALEAAYLAKQTGRDALYYRGIPVVDVRLNSYHKNITDMPHSFAILTDRRNLALAVNTSDYPGTEVRMWYNPDEMENRQRAIFMAGCEYLLPELMSVAFAAPITNVVWTSENGVPKCSILLSPDIDNIDCIELSTYTSEGELETDAVSMEKSGNTMSLLCEEATEVGSYNFSIFYKGCSFSTCCNGW